VLKWSKRCGTLCNDFIGLYWSVACKIDYAEPIMHSYFRVLSGRRQWHQHCWKMYKVSYQPLNRIVRHGQQISIINKKPKTGPFSSILVIDHLIHSYMQWSRREACKLTYTDKHSSSWYGLNPSGSHHIEFCGILGVLLWIGSTELSQELPAKCCGLDWSSRL